jgi:hypothetical protein
LVGIGSMACLSSGYRIAYRVDATNKAHLCGTLVLWHYLTK